MYVGINIIMCNISFGASGEEFEKKNSILWKKNYLKHLGFAIL